MVWGAVEGVNIIHVDTGLLQPLTVDQPIETLPPVVAAEKLSVIPQMCTTSRVKAGLSKSVVPADATTDCPRSQTTGGIGPMVAIPVGIASIGLATPV